MINPHGSSTVTCGGFRKLGSALNLRSSEWQERKRDSPHLNWFGKRSASKDTMVQLDARKRNCHLGCKKRQVLFFTPSYEHPSFTSITQAYVHARESHTVSGEVKEDSVPEGGNFYSLSSGNLQR